MLNSLAAEVSSLEHATRQGIILQQDCALQELENFHRWRVEQWRLCRIELMQVVEMEASRRSVPRACICFFKAKH